MLFARDPLVDQFIAEATRAGAHAGDAVDGIDGQGEAVGLVADGQLQRRIDVAVLLVAAHVDVVLARPPVGESVDQPRVSVEGEDHRPVRREDGLEIAVRHAVRMFSAGQQFEEVHDVDDPDLHVGEVLPHQGGGGQTFYRRHVAAARHHHVGLGPLVVAGPVPDAQALGTVGDRRLHVQVLHVLGLLVGDDDVDVVLAAEAVVADREQAVGVGRQVDAHDAGALIRHHVEEAGVLVREPVVVLAPDQAADQDVERRHLRPPRQLVALLQPLGVLVDHRIDEVDKRLVAVDQAVPAAEDVALQPTFQGVLAEHLHAAWGC